MLHRKCVSLGVSITPVCDSSGVCEMLDGVGGRGGWGKGGIFLLYRCFFFVTPLMCHKRKLNFYIKEKDNKKLLANE